MKKTKMKVNQAMMLMLLSCLSLLSCKNDDPLTPATGAGELNGNITSARTLSSDTSYTITGPVVVEAGGVLTIPAGTTILAQEGFNNYILVLQGGKIYVNGTADKPVRITADKTDAKAGHWGGLVINGRAPLANGTTGSTEISSSHIYGGTDPNDNSGIISYLILEYTGARSSTDVEHNGLTLNGVGKGTTIHDVFITEGSDDGIECFGGTVQLRNLFVHNTDDDMFDFTQGFTGSLENAYGIWDYGFTSSESDPRGIEADGNLDGNFPTHTGQSDFTVKNITFDLRLAASSDTDVANVSNKMQDIVKIRRGAKAGISNALVKGTGTVIDLVDCSDGKGTANTACTVSLSSTLVNPILGKQINPATGFDGVRIDKGNTGCATDIFSWTKYKF